MCATQAGTVNTAITAADQSGDTGKDRSPIEVLRLYPPHGDTLWGLVESRAGINGNQPFLVFENIELTWPEFRDQVHRTACMLNSFNINRGGRVAIMAVNSADYVVIFFAAAAIGAIFVPINPELTAAETSYILNHAQPALVFCTEASNATLHAACKLLTSLPQIVLLSSTLNDIEIMDHANDPPWDKVLADGGASPESNALILYTSGTTGFPKGVMHTQRSIIMAGEYFVERLHLQPEDRLLCILPFFHINALLYSLIGAAAAGASLIIAPRFSASGFWKLAARSRATQVNIIAAVGRILIRRPRSEFTATHQIRKLYGAPITADIYDAFQREFHIPILIEGYGTTEVPGVCSNPYAGPHKVGSIGIPTQHPDHDRPHAAMRIVDESGKDVPPGAVGELLVHSPIVMQGYYRDPCATRAAFRNGWFLTGDLVRQESDGYYTFVERQKDIIRRRGENISGAELDQVFGFHPDVHAVATVAVESELGEDDILIAVVKKPGSILTEGSLHDWGEQHLNPSKVPRYIVFVDALPYTPSHRVAKFLLRQDNSLRQHAVEFPAVMSTSPRNGHTPNPN